MSLLEEVIQAPPEISQHVTASDGGIISRLQQIIVKGDYYAAIQNEKPHIAHLFKAYRNFINEEYGILDFRGIMQIQNVVRLRLEEIFVPLHGIIYPKGASSEAGEPVAEEYQAVLYNTRVHQPTRVTLRNLVRDTPFLVLLGDPGAGKSTLVRYLLVSLAQGLGNERFGLMDEWLPILFPVAAFAERRDRQRELSPLDYLSEYYIGFSQPDYGSLFRRALVAGRALVLFDGLDEVRENRLEIVRVIESFVREWDDPGNRFIATSRIAGYLDAPLDHSLFLRSTLVPFDDEDIKRFVRQWSYAYERAGMSDSSIDSQLAKAELSRRAQARSASLYTAVSANSSVNDLAHNPLLLTIIALIHNQGVRLPDRRVDLYRLCVEALAETWNRARSLSKREIDNHLGGEKIDERFVVNLLGPAALWIHSENPGGIVEEADLVAHLKQTIMDNDGLPPGRAQRVAFEFVDIVRRHTGLLQERGHKRYGFLHLTFEEYLAARAMIDSASVKDVDDLIHARSDDPGWREVFRLAAAAATQREAQRFLLHLLKAPTTPATRPRPAILAAECLLDIGRSNTTIRMVQAVAERLVSFLSDTKYRYEVLDVLGKLDNPHLLDTTLGDNIIGNYWCVLEREPFWIGDDRSGIFYQMPAEHLPKSYKLGLYPVSNVEYAKFMECSGYSTHSWWGTNGKAFLKTTGNTAPGYWNDSAKNQPTQPVVGVSWYEANAYCAWLTDTGHRAGWLPQKDVIRLPTSLEWEFAARHHDKRTYPWGDERDNVNRVNCVEASLRNPSPAGFFPESAAACGAQDLVGNVWEWTATPNEQLDQTHPVSDADPLTALAVRGGGYTMHFNSLFNSLRIDGLPNYRTGERGFRVVWIAGE